VLEGFAGGYYFILKDNSWKWTSPFKKKSWSPSSRTPKTPIAQTVAQCHLPVCVFRLRGLIGLWSVPLFQLFGGPPRPGPHHYPRSVCQLGQMAERMVRQHADRKHIAKLLLGGRPLLERTVLLSSFRKPHASSDLSEIARYVFEKYIKRKFVKDRQLQDPLTLFKQGKFTPYKSETKQQ
jgi:hypothetical protein